MSFQPTKIVAYLVENKDAAVARLRAGGKIQLIKDIRNHTGRDGLVRTDFLNPVAMVGPLDNLGLKEALELVQLLDPEWSMSRQESDRLAAIHAEQHDEQGPRH
jgi:hypothetical protein